MSDQPQTAVRYKNLHPHFRKPKWTKAEDNVIAANYYRFGKQRTAELINEKYGTGRTAAAVQHRARKALNHIGIPEKWVALSEVHSYDSGDATLAVRLAAKRDGVLRFVNAFGGRTAIVPADWADKYVEERAEIEAKVRMTSSWMTTAEVAKMFGVSLSYVQVSRHRPLTHRLARALHSVRKEWVKRNGFAQVMWHPDDARAAARLYKPRKKKEKK